MIENRSAPRREVQHFETLRGSGGASIYQIPLQVFPVLWGFVYVVLLDDPEVGQFRVLIDAGSGFGDSNLHLEAGLQRVSELSGQAISLENLTHILITHGHIDHFGGLTHIRSRTPALIGVHELDLRNLTSYEERLVVVARRLEIFLAEAGLPAERRAQLIEMYKFAKSMVRSVRVDFTYEAEGMRLGPFEFLHVPGHCAGQVVIRLQDVLFSGDHVLEDLSPHQSPESLTHSTGLEHYLHSLDAVQNWAKDVRLTLGGHRKPIFDLQGRIHAIRQIHQRRLEQVLEMLEAPHTIDEISQMLFGEVHGYNVLLALEETGAHVEYLAQRALLRIHNLSDVDENHEPVPVLYQRTDMKNYRNLWISQHGERVEPGRR
jgi:glyoxylase-like metal-dependent hydrolase (beta-lactamase superfamily II)